MSETDNVSDRGAHEEVLGVMQSLEKKPAHVRHVGRLALLLFDQLASLHGLGLRERGLLNAASHLHDIGHQSDFENKGHHKESARLIRQHEWRNFPPDAVEIVAQVSRYHRRAMPEMKHDEFRRLGPGDRRIVQHLAAILRLADALDRTHGERVTGVRVEIRPNQLVFHLEAAGPVTREVRAAQRKGDLACAVFHRDLVFMVGEDVVRPGDDD